MKILNKLKKPKANEPRQLADIEKENGELLAKTAQLQYLIYVYKLDLENLNKRLVSVNTEAAARKDLDAAIKQQEKKDNANK